MKPLFSEEEFEKAKNKDKLLCECYNCNKPFLVEIRYIRDALKGKSVAKFCSQNCNSSYRGKNHKKDCPICGRIISVSNFKLHISKCKGKIPIKIDRYLNNKGEYKCPYCDKIYKAGGIAGHIWRHENPNARKNWSEKIKQQYKDGKRKINNQHTHGREIGKIYVVKESTKEKLRKSGTLKRHSDVTKQIIRKQKIKLYQEQPDKIPFKMYKYFEKSYPEKTFEHGLTSNTITNYVYDYKQGMYYYDFAIPDLKIDFEIDGDFHNKPERIIRDNLRDEYTLKNGWTVIRFEARLVLKDLDYCIEQVKKIIENFDKYKGQKIKFWYKEYINEKATPN